jgi:amino acid adenylation domain-containing protein
MPATPGSFTIFDFLGKAAARHPERRFLFDQERSITYRQALDQANRIAGWMSDRGVRRGDRVLIALQNRVETPLILLAAARLGAIFSVLSPQLKPERFAGIVAQCEPAVVFLDAGTADLARAAGDLPVVWVDAPARGGVKLDEVLNTPPTDAPLVGGGNETAFLVFTSGSTGAPRGVMLSHANVAFVTQAIQARLEYRTTDRIALFLPLSFDYGLYQIFYAAMGGGELFVGKAEGCGPELPRLLAKLEISVLPVVPGLAAVLIKALRYRPTPLPSLRLISNTGEHLPRAHLEQLRQLLPQARIFPMYGLTECKRVSILLPEELEDHPDSVGRALDGTSVWAEAPDGTRLPPGEVGQLVVSGPNVARGYWRDPDATAERFRDMPDGTRQLRTGDFGSVDAAGFIRFHSRGEHVIKHRGHRLSPMEVEEAACLSPHVTAAGCVKDEERDLLCLFVTAKGTPPESAVLLAELASRIERGKLPDRVIVVPDLPRTPNHKLDRSALRALLARAQPTA